MPEGIGYPPGQGPAPQPGQPAPSPEPEQGQGGGAAQLFTDIHSKMMQAKDLMDKSPALSPEDKQAFEGIVSSYRMFVQQNLGGGGQQQAPQAPQAPQPGAGNVPMEAGAGNVRPAL